MLPMYDYMGSTISLLVLLNFTIQQANRTNIFTQAGEDSSQACNVRKSSARGTYPINKGMLQWTLSPDELSTYNTLSHAYLSS
jgi:hypothetical protein